LIIKVLILIPNLNAGGAERVLINLLNQFDNGKYDITLYLGTKTGSLLNDIPDYVKVKAIFSSSLIPRFSEYIFRKLGIRLIFKMYSIKVRGQYDVAISFLDGSFSEFLFHNSAIIRKRVLVVHSSYNSFSNVSKSVHSKHYSRMKLRYSKVDTIVAVSHDSMNEFKRLFGSYQDMRVIYNPLNTNEILEKSLQKINDTRLPSIQFIAIGSLVPVKGFDRLVQAANSLKKDGINFSLQILGNGPLRNKLQSQIDKFGLNDYISLLGFIQNPYPYLKNSDALVMSSHSEGLPTVLCEAMILDKPVIVPEVTGCREVVDMGKYGLMVENSAEGLYQGMKLFSNDENLREQYKKKAMERKVVFNDSFATQAYADILI
jgi:glycosyltransferase involved in cell wall biosynthesis